MMVTITKPAEVTPPPQSNVGVWRYSFPNVNGMGWAIFFIDDAGCFAALSDYGDWSYRWNMRGMPEGKGVREFLLTCDDDYILRKIAPKREYDSEGTVKAVKEFILGMRREQQLTAEEAREEWDLIDFHEGLDNEYNFWGWNQDSNLPEKHELYQTRYSLQARAFLEKCMPRLRTAIKNELGL